MPFNKPFSANRVGGRLWLVLRTVSIFLLIAWLGLCGLAGCKSKAKPVRAFHKDITQAVYASGKVYPVKYYKVAPSLPGYLQKLFVKVGDTVSEGSALFSVKNDVSSLNLASSQNTLRLAQANSGSGSPLIRAAGDEVEAAYARYRLDSTNYSRYAGLQLAGAGTRQALDQARTQFETSKANLARAKENLHSTRLRLRVDFENAQNAFQAQKSSKDDFTVKSSIRGRVYDQVPNVGEYVGPQTVVMELGETDKYEVELSIDEVDINYVKPGQKVVFGSDAFGKVTAHGVVQEVYPKISQTNRSIKAIASITLHKGQMVYAGSTLEANIIYKTKRNALVLPKAYVINDSVTLRRKSKYVKQAITTGLSDVQFVEVLAGIDDKTEVYRP